MVARIGRRHALVAGPATALAPAALGSMLAGCAPEAPATAAFVHGVAAGDPTSSALVLWTRLSGVVEPTLVHFRVARDEALDDVVANGMAEALLERDFTVKVDVGALPAGTTLYYGFDVVTPMGLVASPVGRAKTLARSVDSARIGVATCASLAHGYLHGYRSLASRDLDLVLHLGDYIYEYGTGEYGSLRPYEPEHECRTLSDYRLRYAQYRRETPLQALHAAHAVSVIWDDHEFANNGWPGGSPWHDASTKGIDWSARRDAARRAFFEWMPVRESAMGIQRAIALGDLCDVVLLDTRMDARSPPATTEPERSDPTRRIISAEQEDWLLRQLARPEPAYRLVAQQVLFGHHPELYNWDSWEGFPVQRARVLDAMARSGTTNVWLTGDSHASWATELALDPFGAYEPTTGDGSIGIELGVPALSSPNLEPDAARLEEARVLAASPHTRFTEHSSRGFVVLELDRTRVRASHVFVDGVIDPNGGTERPGPVHEVLSGTTRFVRP